MKLYEITDKEYERYGRVLTDEYAVDTIIQGMAATPAPDHVIYVASDPALEALPQAAAIQNGYYGGMPIEVGYCNGTNHKLDACEYHRCPELGIAVTDLILLLGDLRDVTSDYYYDTDRIVAFRVPAGCVYEMYGTTLHYAPCSIDGQPFKNVVILPKGTNDELTVKPAGEGENKLLFAVNKWLIAHKEAQIEGAWNGLRGVNITLD